MLTEEQIKKLKKGDKLIAEVFFSSSCKDGDLMCNAPFTGGTGNIAYSGNPYHLSCLSLPRAEPKYDPCRRFKKGDKVRIVPYKGRDFNREAELSRGKVAEVLWDEAENVLISVLLPNDNNIAIDPAYLELVTPVEERIPYAIDPANTNIILKYDQKFAEFEDDDDAEECCKMLNDAWRKEQGK